MEGGKGEKHVTLTDGSLIFTSPWDLYCLDKSMISAIHLQPFVTSVRHDVVS